MPHRKLLAVTALAGVIAVGASGASALAPLRVGRPDPLSLLVVLLAAAAIGVAAARGMGHVADRRGVRHTASQLPSGAARIRQVLPIFVVVVTITGLFGISQLQLDTALAAVDTEASGEAGEGREGRLLRFLDDRSSPVRAGEGTGEGTGPALLERGAIPMIAVLLLGLVGSVAAFGWWWLTGRSRDPGEAPADRVDAEAARGTVLRSIEAMLADPDPNTAVIGAYARLLEGLAAAGVPRRDFEGPVEHLRRALIRLEVRPDPVQRLVGLFEVARFSTQALTGADRNRALAALREVAGDLDDEAADVLAVSSSPSEEVSG